MIGRSLGGRSLKGRPLVRTHRSSSRAYGTSGSPTVVLPILTLPEDNATSDSTATGIVYTNVGNGALFVVVTQSAVAPSAQQVIDGTDENDDAADIFFNQAIVATGEQTVLITNLIASTLYYIYFVQQDEDVNTSNVAAGDGFTTDADSTAPVLSLPTGVTSGATTADLTVTTNEAGGIIYVVVTSSVTQPTAQQIREGKNDGGTAAEYAGTMTPTIVGIQSDAASGLTAGATRYAHFVQDDGAVNESNRVTSASFTLDVDAGAPTLSNMVDTFYSETTAKFTVDTDEGNGVIDWVVTTSTTSPSVAQIKAGQDHTSAAMPAGQKGQMTVTAVDTYDALAITGLTANTFYAAHAVQTDLATNVSNVISGDGLTTLAVSTPTISSPTGTSTGDTSASLGISSDELNGTIRWVLTPRADAPSVAQIKAGTDDLDVAALEFGSKVITASPETILVTGLTVSVEHHAHFVHTDHEDNDSNVATAAAFTTGTGTAGQPIGLLLTLAKAA